MSRRNSQSKDFRCRSRPKWRSSASRSPWSNQASSERTCSTRKTSAGSARQLGNGTADGAGNYIPHPLPARIQLDNNGTSFSNLVMVAARDWHNIAVKSDGSVWQWGANDQGQCGDNTTIDRWRPVQVTGLGPR